MHYVTMEFPSPSETFATNDVRMLTASGVDVTVHTLRPDPPERDALVAKRGVQNVPVGSTNVQALASGVVYGVARPRRAASLVSTVVRRCASNPEHLTKSLALAPRALDIFRRIERARPHVVHLHWGHYPSLVGHLVQAHLSEVVVSISLAAYDLEMRYGLSGPVARRADMVRTLGRVNVPSIANTFDVPASDVVVIPDGVDMDAFAIASREAKVAGRVVTAGRLIPSKAMADVLMAFAKVLPSVPHASLEVLGEGPEREELERRVKELGIERAVRFRGHVAHEEVFVAMARAEAFLFMSDKTSERLPNVVKEAMGCRCLCIATDTPGIDELLTHGKTGWIVSRNDVDAAARYLLEALRERADGRRDAMRTRAFEHLEHHFALRVSVHAYIRAWRQLAAEARGRPVGAR